MFNLMKIEFKKNKMKSDIFGVVLANIAIFIASTITAILVGFKDVSQENVILLSYRTNCTGNSSYIFCLWCNTSG